MKALIHCETERKPVATLFKMTVEPTITGKAITPSELGLDSDTQWPEFLSIKQQAELVELEVCVPSSLVYFDGHFPEQAVLPGVVQIHWAVQLAQKMFTVGAFVSAPSVKFNSMVLPNAKITLELKFNPATQNVRFAYHGSEEKHSSGSLQFTDLSSTF